MLRWVIGECLRQARRAQGRSLRDVAEEAGVSIGHLSEVERGRKEASSEVLAAICRALGLDLLDLLRLAQLELARWRAPRLVSRTDRVARTERAVGAADVGRAGPVARPVHRRDVVLAA